MSTVPKPPLRGIGRLSRPILLLAAVLLAATLRAPLWSTRMESPQYRGDEALEILVYAGEMRGDLREIQTLNQYIGVHLPERVPELRLVPWAFGFLLAVILFAAALPSAARRKAALAALVLMLSVAVAGMGLLHHRLEEFGHNRTHSIVARVPDFSPPLLGTAKIANFTVRAGLELGAWAYLAALLLVGSVAFLGKADVRCQPAEVAPEQCEPFDTAVAGQR